jgi:hypothetical protein
VVTVVAVGSAAPGSAATIAVAWPAAYTPTAGDRAHLYVGGKYGGTATDATINQGFTQSITDTGGTGGAANDTGICKCQLFEKLLVGSDTAPTVTAGGTAYNSWEYVLIITRPSGGTTYRDALGNAANYDAMSDTTTAVGPTSGTADFTGVEPTDGDALLAFATIPTDTGSALNASSSFSTSLSGGTVNNTSTNYIENTLGQDTASAWMTYTGFTGTHATPQANFTITGTTNNSGVVLMVSVREQAAAAAGSPILVMPPRSY